MNRRRFLQMLGLGALIPAALSLPPLPAPHTVQIKLAVDTSEIDAMLRAMWDGFKVSPTEMYVGGEDLQNIRDLVLAPEHYNCRCTLEAGDMIHEGGNVYRLKVRAKVTPYGLTG